MDIPDRAAAPSLPLIGAVCLLAVSQLFGYGTIYYAYAVVAPVMAADFGVDPAAPFAVLTLALLVSGLCGPFAGRWIDRFGAPRAMRLGSLLVAGLYLALAAAPGFAVAAVLVVVLQIASLLVLYTAAFPTLALYGRDRGKQGMIWLGLLGGISASVFWPLSGWLVSGFGWRSTFVVFALLHLAISLPVHMRLASMRIVPVADAAPLPGRAPAAPAVPRRLAFWLIALSFGLSGIVSTALMTHMVHLLSLRGLGEQTYGVAALVGPSMMAVRLAEVLFWPRAHPLVSAVIAALCFPTALLVLVTVPTPLIAGTGFALLYGAGHGLAVTSGGTLPLRIFGTQGYAEMLGRIGAVRVLFGAMGPLLLAYGLSRSALVPSFSAGITLSIAGMLPLLVLAVLIRRPPPANGAAS